MKLYEIARAVDRAGRMALVEGTELRRLELMVPVGRKPDRDPRRFWRTSTATAGGWFARWLKRLPLVGRNHGAQHFVRISWVDGAISAAPVRPPHPLQS